MVNKRELRVGNYITDVFSETKMPFKVKWIGHIKLRYGSDYKAKYDNINPIPLTEELLNKSPSFLKSHDNHGTTYHVLKNGYEVKWTLEHWNNIDPNSKYYNQFFISGYGKVKYLHELQNYYHLFEKKEMEVIL